MRTHPDIGLMTARQQLAADRLQLVRFWLYKLDGSITQSP